MKHHDRASSRDIIPAYRAFLKSQEPLPADDNGTHAYLLDRGWKYIRKKRQYCMWRDRAVAGGHVHATQDLALHIQLYQEDWVERWRREHPVEVVQ